MFGKYLDVHLNIQTVEVWTKWECREMYFELYNSMTNLNVLVIFEECWPEHPDPDISSECIMEQASSLSRHFTGVLPKDCNQTNSF